MIKNILITLILMIFGLTPLSAQVEWNGTADFQLSAGGKGSRFIKNGISKNFRYAHINIPQINLLAFAPLSESYFVQARLQTDTWGTGELGTPRFTLANLTWADPKKDYSISVGRFISPVGFYTKQSLTIDRTFVDLPLSYSYFTNVSEKRGFWRQAGEVGTYTDSDVGLSTVYFGSYSTGVLFDWTIKENVLRLETSLSTTSPASDRDYTNLANAALLGRLTYKPNIYFEFGLSGAHSSFMQLEEAVNGFVRQQNPLEQYRQTVVGLDVQFGYGFWAITAETIFSNWSVPRFLYSSFVTNNLGIFEKYSVSNLGANLDIRFEPPAFSGSYFAIRTEMLSFFDTNDPVSGNSIQWDENVSRLTAVFGYKLSRNVESKISFSEQSPYDNSLYTFRVLITTFF